MLAIVTLDNLADRIFLDELFRINYKMLNKLADNIVHDKECAGDVVTNAMLSLFSLVPKLRAMEEQERVAYLRKTVRRAAYKYYNANKRQSITELPLDDDLLFSIPGKDNDPADKYLQDEEFLFVREAVAALPEKDRRVLYLKYAADLTAEEIADLTAAPSAAAVRERLSRARRKVLAQLHERGWSNDRAQEHPGAAGAVGGQIISTNH